MPVFRLASGLSRGLTEADFTLGEVGAGKVSVLMTAPPQGPEGGGRVVSSQPQQATLTTLPVSPDGDNVLSLFWVQFLVRLIHKELSCPGPAAGIQAP